MKQNCPHCGSPDTMLFDHSGIDLPRLEDHTTLESRTFDTVIIAEWQCNSCKVKGHVQGAIEWDEMTISNF